MGRGRIVFVPRVEEFEELLTDLVLYAPTSGTPQKIVAFYQHALGGEPWPWKMGDWTNLGEALRSAGEWGRQRLVIKHHRLPSGLGPDDLQSYLIMLADHAQGDDLPPTVLVFAEKDRQKIEEILAP